MNNLKKQHFIMVDKCYMCKRNVNSVGHLLLHIVKLLMSYKMFSSVNMDCLGLCLDE